VKPPTTKAFRSWAVVCVVAGLLCILLPITTASARAQKAASTSPHELAADTTSVEDLETLAATINNDQARQLLLDQIQALIAVKRETVPKQDDRPISERLAEAASATVEETSHTFAEISRYFPNRQALKDWIDIEISSPAKLSQNAKKALPFVWIFGVAWLVEFLSARSLAGLRKRLEKRAHGTLVARLPLSVARAALRICAPAAFAVAALAVFFFLQPGAAIGKVSFQIFAAYISGRVLMILARMVLAPSTPSLRLVPLSSEPAHSLFKSIRRLVTVALFGYLLASTALLFGLPPRGFAALTNLLGLILTVMLVVFILKNRSAVAEWIRGVELPSGPSNASRSARRSLAAVWHMIAIVYLLGLFIVWWQHIEGGLIYLFRSTLLSALIVFAAWLLVHGLSRAAERASTVSRERYRLSSSLKQRAQSYVTPVFIIIRGAVTLIAILSVLESWKLDAYSWLTTPVGQRILSIFFSIVLVVGIAVAIWEVVNLSTERYLAETEKSGKTFGQSARARTLLPLMRKALLMVLSIIVVLIVLSEIGVHIGPLLAGAGIVGLAVGFGAQKLVQDIITGVFILLEDAVAVGDVVKVAGIGGLVEDLSIRSIRLRDLSGNVHTIPFSSVDTVTNMTKLYSYYLIDIGVAYREDTDKVADVFREIVDDMRSDPEFGPDILEPLEVLGVDQFTDSAVIIKARIKTRPIRQWAVGREFNRRMKKRFDELGIEIPFPHRTLYFGAGKDGSAPPIHMVLEKT
jgi:small conductance mechanosensitive channel